MQQLTFEAIRARGNAIRRAHLENRVVGPLTGLIEITNITEQLKPYAAVEIPKGITITESNPDATFRMTEVCWPCIHGHELHPKGNFFVAGGRALETLRYIYSGDADVYPLQSKAETVQMMGAVGPEETNIYMCRNDRTWNIDDLQVMLFDPISVSKTLHLFDLPVAAVAVTFVDGRQDKTYATEEALLELAHQTIIFNPLRISYNMHYRVRKYIDRGISFRIPSSHDVKYKIFRDRIRVEEYERTSAYSCGNPYAQGVRLTHNAIDGKPLGNVVVSSNANWLAEGRTSVKFAERYIRHYARHISEDVKKAAIKRLEEHRIPPISEIKTSIIDIVTDAVNKTTPEMRSEWEKIARTGEINPLGGEVQGVLSVGSGRFARVFEKQPEEEAKMDEVKEDDMSAVINKFHSLDTKPCSASKRRRLDRPTNIESEIDR